MVIKIKSPTKCRQIEVLCYPDAVITKTYKEPATFSLSIRRLVVNCYRLSTPCQLNLEKIDAQEKFFPDFTLDTWEMLTEGTSCL